MAINLTVLDGLRLFSDADELQLSGGSQRLLAFVALQSGPVTREAAAGALFAGASGRHAYARLRAAIARLPATGREAVDVTGSSIARAPGLTVDVYEARAMTRRILDAQLTVEDERSPGHVIEVLSKDILPGWYDQWVVDEAEQWRHLRLHALEALSDALTERGRYAYAVDAALAAIRSEPLRETARVSLIRALVAEGNRSEALREHQRYCELLQSELGIPPSPHVTALVQDLLPAV